MKVTSYQLLRRLIAEEPANDGCIEWPRVKSGAGYGGMTVNKKRIYAHRLAYELTHGSIPKGLFICHRCDNRICVRPSHLFAGTHEDNMRDKVSKGRAVRGEKHGCAILTTEKVLFVLESRRNGATLMALAKQFGVSESMIHLIDRGKKWRHVTEAAR